MIKVAILTESSLNSYGAVIAAHLLTLPCQVCMVVCTESSRLQTLRRRMRRDGYWRTAKRALLKILLKIHGGSRDRDDSEDFLGDYCKANGIDWNGATIRQVCVRHGIPIVTVPSPNSPEAVSAIADAGIDVLVNTSGALLRKQIISAPRTGIVNAHMAQLPKYRGMNVLEWSLLCGDPVAVTLHFIHEGVDNGDVIASRAIPLRPGDTIQTLRAQYAPAAVELVADFIKALDSGKARWTPQRPEDGRQYYVMHHRLRALAQKRLQKLAG